LHKDHYKSYCHIIWSYYGSKPTLL
jgi:hypothetical protein